MRCSGSPLHQGVRRPGRTVARLCLGRRAIALLAARYRRPSLAAAAQPAGVGFPLCSPKGAAVSGAWFLLSVLAADKGPVAPLVDQASMVAIPAGAFAMGVPVLPASPYGDVWFEDQQ